MFEWSRYHSRGYEVSSKGDSRFSALYARLSDGRTVEEAYQLDVKGYRKFSDQWQFGKGKPPLVARDLWPEYLRLWEQFARENPELVSELRDKARGKVLTDMFASTLISQARAWAHILNSPELRKGGFDWVAELDRLFPRDGSYIAPLSDKWKQARRGRLTSSGGANTIVPFGDRGIATLLKKKHAEFSPDWTWKELNLPQLDWGRQYEAAALASIELAIGTEVTEPGTVFHPRRPYCSSTPDGLIEGRVTVQIKCPHKPQFHLQTLYGPDIRKQVKLPYYRQVQWEAWVCGAEEIMFASFDPQQPLATRLVMVNVPIDNELVDIFERNVDRFKELMESGVSNPRQVEPIGIPQLF